MIDVLTTLTWPGAVAILGSVISVVAGILAIFSSYFKTLRDNAKEETREVEHISQVISQADVNHIHDRISSTKERLAALEGSQKLCQAQLQSLAERIESHGERDINDFKMLNQKVDKIMEIIVEMLRDER